MIPIYSGWYKTFCRKTGRAQSSRELAADRSIPVIHEDLSGRTLSHYQIVRPMGAGGMGVVYRATETRLQRTVALKFLPPLLRDDSASRERFIREACVIASIDHQNVCPVYEIEEADGFIFIAMACLEGTSLEEKIRAGPIPVKQASASHSRPRMVCRRPTVEVSCIAISSQRTSC